MKVKLLKKLRKKGRNQIFIHSVSKVGETITGMGIGYNDRLYSNLFQFGMTEEEVLKAAEKIYINQYLDSKRDIEKKN